MSFSNVMHNEYGNKECSASPLFVGVGVVSIICSLTAVNMPKIDVTADEFKNMFNKQDHSSIQVKYFQKNIQEGW